MAQQTHPTAFSIRRTALVLRRILLGDRLMRRDRPFLVFSVPLIAWFLTSCATQPYPNGHVDSHAADWIRVAGPYRVEMFMAPANPKAGEDVAIEFLILDVSREPAMRVRGAYVRCSLRLEGVEGSKQNHSARTDILKREAGIYPLRIVRFPYGGQWDLTANAQLLDDTSIFARFTVSVDGPPWPQDRHPEQTSQPNLY